MNNRFNFAKPSSSNYNTFRSSNRSKQGEILDLAVDYNIIEKSGSWYSYNGEKMGQGRENAKLFLKENPFIMEEIADLIRAELSIPTSNAEDMMSEE